MPWVDTGDVRLFHTVSGDGPPVLLVHGWCGDSDDWIHQLPSFADTHLVVAPDLRGHGRSSAPPGPYDPRTMARDMAALLRAVGVGPVVAVGHSLGAAVVSALAVEAPALVRAVVSVEPAYGMSASIHDDLRGHAVSFRGPDGPERARGFLASMEGPHTPRHLLAWHGRRAVGTAPHVVAEAYAAMYEPADQFCVEPATSSYMQGRNCPVLSFHVRPRAGAHAATLTTDARSRQVVWEGVGHWPHQERPREFDAVVLDWIDALG